MPSGSRATVHNALLVQVSAALASLLPISPSGIGTEQAFLLYLFGGQVAGTALVTFSVGMRVTLITVNTALGFATTPRHAADSSLARRRTGAR